MLLPVNRLPLLESARSVSGETPSWVWALIRKSDDREQEPAGDRQGDPLEHPAWGDRPPVAGRPRLVAVAVPREPAAERIEVAAARQRLAPRAVNLVLRGAGSRVIHSPLYIYLPMPPRRVIGIDAGGTKLLGGVVDEQMVVHHRVHRTWRGADRQETLDIFTDAVEEVRAAASDVEAIGFGVPALVESETGVTRWSNHLPSWTACPSAT